MDSFPRTEIGGQSVSRMVIGTNWFIGYSHTTAAKDGYINENVRDRKKIADIIEVFFKAGIDTIIGMIQNEPLSDAIKEAEDRTGVEAVIISTPGFPVSGDTLKGGFNNDAVRSILDTEMNLGVRVCMPHQMTTDCMVDRCTREIRQMDTMCKLIRERGMIPGLGTHMPETIIYADKTGLDVETYISMFNSAGFLMQLEVDWVARIIRKAKKPVLTIKPMAAGQLRPLQGLTFSWNTIRDQDMVAVGTMAPAEAEEVIELSRSILERRTADLPLQETRSKTSVKA